MPIRREVPPNSQFNNYRVIHEVESHNHKRFFLCECDCGNQTVVCLDKLGKTKNCKQCYGKFSHLFRQVGLDTTFALEHTHVWQLWHSMMTKIKSRGHLVCAEWYEFENYLRFYVHKTGLQLSDVLSKKVNPSFFHAERIDKEQPWSPENATFIKFVTERARDDATFDYWHELKTKGLLADELLSYKEFVRVFGLKRAGWRLARRDTGEPHTSNNSYWKANASTRTKEHSVNA